MARRFRPRKEYKFQLYRDIEEQVRLMEYVAYLRKTKQFVTAVRNGLRLMWTLGQGDLSVLFELFPTLQAQFKPDNSALIEEFRALLQTQAVAIPQLVQLQAPATGHALPAPRVLTPTLDDEEDTIIIKVDELSAAQGSANFINAALGMSGSSQRYTADDIGKEDDSDPLAAAPKGSKAIKAKPIAMPTFDDDDDEPLVPALEAGSMMLKKMA